MAKEHAAFSPGDEIAQRYRVDRVLGQGGMGQVLAATDKHLRRRVALKLLLPTLADVDECVARFRREARAAVRLASEHSVRVHDVGELRDGRPFMVMELLKGRDLGAVCEEKGRLSPHEAVDYVLQACIGVAEAHSYGIIHRDLKLANLFLTTRPDGRPLVKVLDFGLAKAPTEAGERSLTDTSAVIGSPAYMSPEQVRSSRDVDVRTDVWSLGVCLYELLTGILPFDAPTVADVIAKVLHDTPPSPDRLFVGISFGLSQAVMRCLEKNPEARFEDIGALASALDEHASVDARGTSEEVKRVLHAAKHRVPTLDAPAEERRDDTLTVATVDSGTRRRRRVIGTVAAATVLSIAVAGSVFIMKTTIGAGTRVDRSLVPNADPSTDATIEVAPKRAPTASTSSAAMSSPSEDAARPQAETPPTASVERRARPKGRSPRPASSHPSVIDASPAATY